MTRIKTSDSSHPDLTKQQTARIEYLRRRYAPRDGYEFKSNEIWLEDWESAVRSYRFVYLVLTTGLAGDEGTLAESYARNRRMFSVGPRGGTMTWNGKRWLPGATWNGKRWLPGATWNGKRWLPGATWDQIDSGLK